MTSSFATPFLDLAFRNPWFPHLGVECFRLSELRRRVTPTHPPGGASAGVPPKAYIDQRVALEAKRLLAHTELPAAETDGSRIRHLSGRAWRRERGWSQSTPLPSFKEITYVHFPCLVRPHGMCRHRNMTSMGDMMGMKAACECAMSSMGESLAAIGDARRGQDVARMRAVLQQTATMLDAAIEHMQACVAMMKMMGTTK